MALNLNFTNAPLLSKVKIGEQTYWLKDAELRALVDAFGNAVNYTVDTAFNKDSANLATSAAIATYLEAQIAGLTGAMHFIGVKDELPASGTDGDIVIVGTAEYVYSNGKWILIGDEGVYATVAGVEEKYVQKALTIAGIDLNDAITADELKTALDLKALAHKDSASGSITTVDAVVDAKYTPAGSVAVNLSHASTVVESAGNFTPVGVIENGKTTAEGSVAIAADEAGYQITGSVAAPIITVTPSYESVQHVESVGKLATYSAAQYTAPTVTEAKSQFASEGMVAAIDTEDAEMLVLSAATKSDALTSTGFNPGSFTDGTFTQGELPTLGQAVQVVSGIEKAEATAPAFTGGKIGATFTGAEAAVTANFKGTEGAIAVSGNYDKASVESANFTGTEATISHELTSSAKTVTVQ